MAVDTAGNVYVTDYEQRSGGEIGGRVQHPDRAAVHRPNGPAVWRWIPPATSTSPTQNNRVLKLAAGSGTQTVLPFTGLNEPAGVAVDTAGNVYVTDASNNRVLKLSVGLRTSQTALPFTGLKLPRGGGGHRRQRVRHRINGDNRVLKLRGGVEHPNVLPFTGLNGPEGVAVDTAGDVYVTDRARPGAEVGGRVEHPDGAAVHRPRLPHGVAVDTAGNVYVTDTGNDRVLKLAAGSTTRTVLPFTGLNRPGGVAVDTAGNRLRHRLRNPIGC